MNDKQPIESDYFYRLRDISRLKPENVLPKLVEFLQTVRPKKLRTNDQNRALHKDCSLIAEKLNDRGIEISKLVKLYMDIPWTTESVKLLIWKPTQAVMFNKVSTTELDKNSNELSEIHEVIMREFAKAPFFLEWHEFPHDPKKKKEWEEMMKPPKAFEDYPENTGEEITAF